MGALSISRKLRHRSEQLFDRRGKTRTDSYAYNTRSELTGASLGANPYTYDYDNIGNRKTAQEIAQESTYAANTLNQYSAITRNQVPFTPTFDPDGNQTLVQTSTGIWKVTYNADSRPVRFTQQGGTTTIDCGYDYMGRRYEKKITVDGTITLHQHYLYRGYLQIAALDKKRTHLPALWYTHWDPTEPTATRPLSIRKNGTWYTYGCDLTKNVQELFAATGAIATTYDYTPFGAVTRQGAFDQPFQWSSEVNDAELALTYYNYRHYNPMDGRWIGMDPFAEQGGYNLYGFVRNGTMRRIDVLGQLEWTENPPKNPADNFSPDKSYFPFNISSNLCKAIPGNLCCSQKITNKLQSMNPSGLVFLSHFLTGRGEAMNINPDLVLDENSEAKKIFDLAISSVRSYARNKNAYDKKLYLSNWMVVSSEDKYMLGDFSIMIEASVNCKTQDVEYTLRIFDVYDYDYRGFSGDELIDNSIILFRNICATPGRIMEIFGSGTPFVVEGKKSGKVEKKPIQ